jgi:hypothetical protein
MIIATRLRPKPGAASATIRGREPRILIEMGQMVAKHKERLFRHVVSFMLSGHILIQMSWDELRVAE